MEEKKKQNGNNTVMVECPFCNKPIEAPDKADTIFTCPNCHKELITYDKIERKKEKLRNERMKQKQIYKKYKKVFKWGSIAALISLFLYIGNTNQLDTNAIYIITEGYKAPINTEAAKAFDQAKAEGGTMKILETIGNDQLFTYFSEGDRVRIIKDIVGGFPGFCKVERISDMQTGLVPKKYLMKDK